MTATRRAAIIIARVTVMRQHWTDAQRASDGGKHTRGVRRASIAFIFRPLPRANSYTVPRTSLPLPPWTEFSASLAAEAPLGGWKGHGWRRRENLGGWRTLEQGMPEAGRGSAQTTQEGSLGPGAQHCPSVPQTVTESPLLSIHVGKWRADSMCSR